MNDNNRKKLELINSNLKDGSYDILQPQKWDEYSRDLANCGVDIFRDIRNVKNCIRGISVKFFHWDTGKSIKKAINDFDVLVTEFDLFYDASMKFLRSIIDGNEYKEYQNLQKIYVEKLTDHCTKSVDYLGNIISSKRNEYYHFQVLNIASLALIIAFISLILSILT